MGEELDPYQFGVSLAESVIDTPALAEGDAGIRLLGSGGLRCVPLGCRLTDLGGRCG
jgi:hypothetical protein